MLWGSGDTDLVDELLAHILSVNRILCVLVQRRKFPSVSGKPLLVGDRGLWIDELSRLEWLQQPAKPVVQPLDGALNFVDFALLEVGFTALVTDPGWDCVEYQVITVAVNMEGRFRTLHLPMTVDAGHLGLLVRQSCSQSSSVGRYAVMDCEKILLGGTDNVDISLVNSTAMQQAAMAACVLGIVLDQFAVHDDISNLTGCNHPVRACHLANCMREKEYALSGGASYLFKGIL